MKKRLEDKVAVITGGTSGATGTFSPTTVQIAGNLLHFLLVECWVAISRENATPYRATWSINSGPM